MNCNRAKSFFSEFFDGRLDAKVADALDDHLNECAACSKAYADYDRFFTALRSVPSLRTERTAPYPETAAAFVRPAEKMSLARRLTAAAAVLIMIGGAAHMGYKWGSGSPQMTQQVAAADILPVPEAGGRVRRSTDGLSNLALLSNRATRVQDPERAANAMTSVLRLSPIAQDADDLLAMRDEDLGSYAPRVRRYASELKTVVANMRRTMLEARPTRDRLVDAWRIVERSDLPSRLAAIEPMARRFEPMTYEDPLSVGVDPIASKYPEDRTLIIGCVRSCAGQRDMAHVFDQYVLASPNSPLSPIALSMRFAQDGGRAGLTLTMPKEVVESFEAFTKSGLSEAPEWRAVFDRARVMFRRIEIRTDSNSGVSSIIVPFTGPAETDAPNVAPAPAQRRDVRGNSKKL